MNIYIMLLIFAAILLQLASFLNFFGDSCEAYRFVKEEGKAFVNHVIKTMTASLKELCWDTCVWLPWCFSLNVRNTSWGSVECELNNSSKKSSPGSLVSKEESDYYQMGDVPASSLSQAVKVLQKEVLEDGWYIYEKSALKLFKDVFMMWVDARSYCQSLGGDLVSISSHHQNEFVYNVFVKDNMNITNGTALEGGVAQFKLDGTDRDIKIHIITGDVRYEVADGRKALYFSGDKALVEIPAVRLTREFTIVVWIRFLEPVAGYSSNIFVGYPSPSFMLWKVTNQKVIKFNLKPDTLSGIVKTNGMSIQYGEWTHIAIRWTGDGPLLTAQGVINGEIAGDISALETFSGAMTMNSSNYTLGMRREIFYDSKPHSFKGHMSNLKMFKRRLSIDEIRKDFAQSIDIPDLSAVWIGLSRANHLSPFLWSDGSPQDDVTSEMTSHHMKHLVTNHHCAAAGKDGQWFGRHCLEEKPFICEKPVE